MVDSARPVEPREAAELPDRLLTIPNLLSIIRLALVPVFLWLLLGPHADGWALLILVFAGITDWLDGKMARWLQPDEPARRDARPGRRPPLHPRDPRRVPARDIVPWWIVALLILREVVVGVCIWCCAATGSPRPRSPTSARARRSSCCTRCRCMLLAQGGSTAATLARPVAYAFTIWGGVLFLWSGVLYLVQTAWHCGRRPVRRPSRIRPEHRVEREGTGP